MLELKLGLVRVPDAKIGGAIVNNDGSGGTEEIVIRLALNLRYERHCVVEAAETVRLRRRRRRRF